MRLAIIGQQAFARDVLGGLLDAGHEIAAVFSDVKDPSSSDPLAEAAEEKGIPLHRPQSFKSDDVYADFRGLGVDLLVMAFVTKIIPQRILELPRLGTIQFHPSLLPRHRGASAINWAILQGDTETGVTIFWPDGGLDTGPILMTKKATIDPADTVGTLYFNKLYPLGVEAMLESVALVEKGTAPQTPQDESAATYEPICSSEHVAVDWDAGCREVFDIVRGGDPQPGAWSTLDGHTVKLYDAELLPDAEGSPGQILDASDSSIVVACRDGGIRIGRVRVDGEKKRPPAEYTDPVTFTEGSRFG